MASSRPAALIVEDQPFVGLVASDILEESGFQTFHAYDAETATQVLDEHPEIGVVVTEAQLPGDVTGLEFCHRVSLQRPGVLLVVTAATPELHRQNVPNGARVLRKPFASRELRTLVSDQALLAEV